MCNITLSMFAFGPGGKKMEKQDPFDFLLEASEISPSQEELLRICVSSLELVNAGKVAAGGSGTQEQEDVFHTPPEKASAPSSADQPLLDHCEINRELDARNDDDETIGFVDLGRDSELGLSDVTKPSQGVGGESVAQSPRGIKRDAVATEESEGFEKEPCVGELPAKKKLKLSEPNLGFGSSGTLEGQVSGEEEDKEKRKDFVFDVLKFLAENTPDDNEDGNGGGNASLEYGDVVKICGIDFPRPRWWPDNDLFRH